ncbi:MAG: VOC family protein [Propionicimonas sp.]|nr:VOC family protein [Propionicimonas sp.]
MSSPEPFLRLTSVTVSCPAPRDLAGFYARLLRGEVTASDPALPGEPADAGWAQVAAGDLRLNFEYERCWTAPTWPAVPGEQTATQHLDIWVNDLAAATEWALACGATLAEVQPQRDVRVMFDPSGHPFCLFL